MSKGDRNGKLVRAIIVVFVAALLGWAATAGWRLTDSVDAANTKNAQQDRVLADDHSQRAVDRVNLANELKSVRENQAALLGLMNLLLDEKKVSQTKRAAAIVKAMRDTVLIDTIQKRGNDAD